LEFKPTLGYLALTYKVDVLPLYLDGTHDALPKGSIFPKQKELAVRIGPALEYDALKARTGGMARSESYREVTRLVEQAVRALKDKKVLNLDAVEPVAPPHRRSSGGDA
jgi:long-chain acyl-CoA synthetase